MCDYESKDLVWRSPELEQMPWQRSQPPV